jgi:hypothetical protein
MERPPYNSSQLSATYRLHLQIPQSDNHNVTGCCQFERCTLLCWSERALERYHNSLEEGESNSTTSILTTSTSIKPAIKTPVSDTVKSTVPMETKNRTSTATLKDVPAESDIERLVSASEILKNETSTEPTAKTNETEPAPTKKVGPLARLSSMLHVKRAELPVLPVIPSITKRQELPELPDALFLEGVKGPIKRQLEDVTGAASKVDEDDLAVPDVKGEDLGTPMVDDKSLDSPTTAINNTAAEASNTAAGYHFTSKHMTKLDKLTAGGLPIKRQAPDFLSTPVAEPEIANPQPTGVLPNEPELDTSKLLNDACAGYRFGEVDSPLYRYPIPLQHQHEKIDTVTEAADSSAGSVDETGDVESIVDTSDVAKDAAKDSETPDDIFVDDTADGPDELTADGVDDAVDSTIE